MNCHPTLHLDLEEITVDPVAYKDRKVIYLALEHPAGIWEYSMVTQQKTMFWNLSEYMETKAIAGIEGMAYVSDESLAGGKFYVGNQKDGHVYIFELTVKDNQPNVKFIKKWNPDLPTKDISGMFWYPWNKQLYFMLDKEDQVIGMNLDGSNRKTWDLDEPTQSQEGIWLFGDSNVSTILIADDHGTAWKAKIKYLPMPPA